MKVTQKMIEQADAAYDKRAEELSWIVDRCCTTCIDAALTAALADVPEPGAKEPGPFVLSEDEEKAKQRLAGCGAWAWVLYEALDRACRTLGPQAAPAPTGDVLTAEERRQVEAFRLLDAEHNEGRLSRSLRIIDRLAPAPKPVEKTNEELAAEVRKQAAAGSSCADCPALDELVRRANEAGK